MKTGGSMLFLSCRLIIDAKAMAQQETKQFSAGFGFEGGILTGQDAKEYSTASGVTGRFAYHAGPGFITLISGIIACLPKSFKASGPAYSGYRIPVRAGYKYLIQRHFFAMGELGYSHLNLFRSHSALETTTNSLTAPISAGVQFNWLELGLRYGFDIGNGQNGLHGLRLGFNF